MLALAPRLPAAADAPLGFTSAGISLINNSDLVAAAPDPSTMYNRVAGGWKRVAGVQRRYTTAQGNDGDQIRAQLTLCGNPSGAAAYLADPDLHPGATLNRYSLPNPLGDGGLMYHEVYTATGGAPRENWRAMWTRGPVVLSVSGDGAPGEFSAQSVAAVATAADARFMRGSVPDILTQPLAPSPVAAPLPQPTS
jgi:hypothetical protein